MENTYIFLPVLAHMLLVVILYIILGKVKNKEAAAGNVDPERRGLYDDAWPASVQKVNNCIKNQFEVPVLFYVLAGISFAINAVDLFIHGIAWLFVLSRYVHAYIHTGSNVVPVRRKVFTLGLLMILVLVIYLAIKII